MKKLLILALIIASFGIALPARATVFSNSYKVGNTTYYSNSLGGYGSSYKVGSTSYYNYSQGLRSLSGSSYKIGNTNYYNLYSRTKSYTGNSYKIGGTTHYNIGNKSYSCYKINSVSYCF